MTQREASSWELNALSMFEGWALGEADGINGAVTEIDDDGMVSITADVEECDCQCCKAPTHWYILAHNN